MKRVKILVCRWQVHATTNTSTFNCLCVCNFSSSRNNHRELRIFYIESLDKIIIVLENNIFDKINNTYRIFPHSVFLEFSFFFNQSGKISKFLHQNWPGEAKLRDCSSTYVKIIQRSHPSEIQFGTDSPEPLTKYGGGYLWISQFGGISKFGIHFS